MKFGFVDASFTVIANIIGLRREEVVSAATQLLLHEQRVSRGRNAEAGGSKTAPRTQQHLSGRKRWDDSSPEKEGVCNATRIALASSFAACNTPARILLNSLLAHRTIPHWMFTHGRQLMGVTVPAGEACEDTQALEMVKAEPDQDLVSDTDDEDEEDGASATKYTGVKIEKDYGKYGVKILMKEGGKRKKQRLGAYTLIDEAAYAYAAAACVLRPRDKIPNTVNLTTVEKALLCGCTKDDLQLLVEARRWWRWRSWREALEGVSSKLRCGRKQGSARVGEKR
ncbi:unnamed protein product [Closterium sp. NIES-53]